MIKHDDCPQKNHHFLEMAGKGVVAEAILFFKLADFEYHPPLKTLTIGMLILC